MSEKRKCILHIGSFKTGTTSLQMTLDQNRETLMEYGFIYPDLAYDVPSIGYLTHAFLVVCCTENHRAWPYFLKKRKDTKASAAQFRREMLTYLAKTAESAGSNTVIFSCEYLVSLHPDRVAELKKYLERYFDEIIFVCYIRHPRSHFVAMAQQYVRVGFGSSRRLFDGMFRPSCLETYINLFGQEALRVREFNRETLVNGDVIDDFCSIMGAPAKLVTSLKRKRANESLSMEAALIASAVDKDLPRLNEGKWNPARSEVLDSSLSKISGKDFSLPPADLQSFENDIDDEVNYVRNRFGLAMKPPQTSAIDSADLWNTETLRDIGLVMNELGQKIEQLQLDNASLRIRLLIKEEKMDEAAEVLQQTFKDRFRTARYYLLLSRIEQARGNHEQARQALLAGQERFPNNKVLRSGSKQLAH